MAALALPRAFVGDPQVYHNFCKGVAGMIEFHALSKRVLINTPFILKYLDPLKVEVEMLMPSVSQEELSRRIGKHYSIHHAKTFSERYLALLKEWESYALTNHIKMRFVKFVTDIIVEKYPPFARSLLEPTSLFFASGMTTARSLEELEKRDAAIAAVQRDSDTDTDSDYNPIKGRRLRNMSVKVAEFWEEDLKTRKPRYKEYLGLPGRARMSATNSQTYKSLYGRWKRLVEEEMAKRNIQGTYSELTKSSEIRRTMCMD
jgi:hypothetical protein